MRTNLGSGPMRLLGLGVLLAWCPVALAQSEMNVPLFLSNSDGMGRQGFVRIINHSDSAGMVTVTATDDDGMSPDPVTLALGARETKHFNSDDLEMNDRDRLSGGVGNPTQGYWRLQISTDLDGVEALAYVRTTADGFLTSMHDRVRGRDMDGTMMHHVRVFNPGSNTNQQSMLRLVNPMADDASVTITGLDDAGSLGEADVSLTLPAGKAMMLSAADLEAEASGRTGALGGGAGKWQLFVSADQAIWVMSLMGTPTGHLTNLSTATSMMDYLPPERSAPPPDPEPPTGGEDPYAAMCVGLEVEPGKLSYGPLNDGPGGFGALEDCATTSPLIQPINDLLNPIDMSRTTVHEAKWQMRADANSAWMDIPGTSVEFDICPYDPEGTAGEYRLVIDQTITLEGGEPARSKCSTSTITVP